jgi:hypothetical protein
MASLVVESNTWGHSPRCREAARFKWSFARPGVAMLMLKFTLHSWSQSTGDVPMVESSLPRSVKKNETFGTSISLASLYSRLIFKPASNTVVVVVRPEGSSHITTLWIPSLYLQSFSPNLMDRTLWSLFISICFTFFCRSLARDCRYGTPEARDVQHLLIAIPSRPGYIHRWPREVNDIHRLLSIWRTI